MPIIFEEPHSSYVKLAIHSVVLNYEFRGCSLNEQTSSKEPVVSIISYNKTHPETNPPFKHKDSEYRDLVHYLFGNEKKIRMEVANEIYNKYIGLLKEALKELTDRVKEATVPSFFANLLNIHKVITFNIPNRAIEQIEIQQPLLVLKAYLKKIDL